MRIGITLFITSVISICACIGLWFASGMCSSLWLCEAFWISMWLFFFTCQCGKAADLYMGYWNLIADVQNTVNAVNAANKKETTTVPQPQCGETEKSVSEVVVKL